MCNDLGLDHATITLAIRGDETDLTLVTPLSRLDIKLNMACSEFQAKAAAFKAVHSDRTYKDAHLLQAKFTPMLRAQYSAILYKSKAGEAKAKREGNPSSDSVRMFSEPVNTAVCMPSAMYEVLRKGTFDLTDKSVLVTSMARDSRYSLVMSPYLAALTEGAKAPNAKVASSHYHFKHFDDLAKWVLDKNLLPALASPKRAKRLASQLSPSPSTDPAPQPSKRRRLYPQSTPGPSSRATTPPPPPTSSPRPRTPGSTFTTNDPDQWSIKSENDQDDSFNDSRMSSPEPELLALLHDKDTQKQAPPPAAVPPPSSSSSAPATPRDTLPPGHKPSLQTAPALDTPPDPKKFFVIFEGRYYLHENDSIDRNLKRQQLKLLRTLAPSCPARTTNHTKPALIMLAAKYPMFATYQLSLHPSVVRHLSHMDTVPTSILDQLQALAHKYLLPRQAAGGANKKS